MSNQSFSSNDSNIEYKECCLSSVAICCSGKICAIKKSWPNECVYISQLQNSVVDYLVAIKVINKQHRDLYVMSEEELLINRLSRIIDIEKPHLKICPNHRFTYGIGWSIPNSCVYLKEDGVICHLQSDRVAPMYLIRSIGTFPFGGKICSKHRTILYENDTQTNTDEDQVSNVHSWEYIGDEHDKMNDVLCMLEQSPIKSQATEIPIQEQASSSLRRLIAKLRRSVAASTISFANSIAPGQGEVLIEMAGLTDVVNARSSSIPTTTANDELIHRLINIYKAFEEKKYPFFERIQLLAILPESMSNKEIMEKFGCSSYAVKTARKLQLTTTTPTHHEESSPIVRSRIDPLLTDHFLSWLINTNMLTTIAWGVTKIKLDRGDVLELPKQVLQGKKSHIICQYQMHCEEMSINSLSDRTLRYILDSINVSEQEALSGIDDIVKDAREAWLTMEDLSSSLTLRKEDHSFILTAIKQNKLYLKTQFVNHCCDQQFKLCPTHCPIFALSQQGNSYYTDHCDHDHYQFCTDCANLINMLDFIDQKINDIDDNEKKDEIKYDFHQAREAIIELMRHLIRGVRQDSAKTRMLNLMDEETAFVTIDWAQKVLQQKFREGQSEYFAKRGMSVLVASFTFKDLDRSKQGQFTTKTYMLALSHCNQNELDTLSGGFLLLQQFTAEHQHIKKIIKRSDNASVLGGHSTFEAEKLFCDQIGIELLVRDYSEIQKGKSICDRMTGAAKLRMRSWMNSGNDLMNASDIKKGMEYCGGVKNIKIAVAEVISDKIKLHNSVSIPEVSLIRSAVYTKDGIIVRKASDIGSGRKIPYTDLQIECNMKLIEPFNPSNLSSFKTKPNERSDRKLNSFYFCTADDCIATFKEEFDLYNHIALGQHVTTDDKMTTLDTAKIQLYDKLRDVNIPVQMISSVPTSDTTTSSHTRTTTTTTTTTEELNKSKTMTYFNTQGWALKVSKPRRRIDESIKSFIKSMLQEEKTYSVKFSDKEFIRRIRTARKNDGTKMFSSEQYLTSSQIKTQIKLLSKQISNNDVKTHKRSNRLNEFNGEEDEEESQYKKTPRSNRKQKSIRTSTRPTTSTQPSQSSNDHIISYQDTSTEDLDEEEEMAFEQEKQMSMLKKKILTS